MLVRMLHHLAARVFTWLILFSRPSEPKAPEILILHHDVPLLSWQTDPWRVRSRWSSGG
jgi:hypothetical protein